MKPLGLERTSITPRKMSMLRPINHLDLLSLQRDIRARTEPKFKAGQVVKTQSGEAYTVQRRYWDTQQWQYAIRCPGKRSTTPDGHKIQGFPQILTVQESELTPFERKHTSVAIYPLPLHNLLSSHYPIIW